MSDYHKRYIRNVLFGGLVLYLVIMQKPAFLDFLVMLAIIIIYTAIAAIVLAIVLAIVITIGFFLE